jgi:zinc-binding alcohol dehydrogenase/oxidoreductase
MQAIVLRELGGPEKLRIENVETPEPNAGEVLIRLKYAALNRRDVWITYGQYPGMKLPTILGSDGAGEVVAIGRDVMDIAEGDHVVINPALNWGNNPEHFSNNYSILGMPENGTFAQYITVNQENVFKKPKYLSWEEAAAIPLGALTAYRAIFTKAKIQKDDHVLIPGIGGGVALLALQMAVAHGAKVFVTSSCDNKIEKAIKLGATGGVNYKTQTWVKELSDLMNGGAHVIIDSVGGPSFNDFIKLAKPAGRIVSFGATSGPIPKLIMPKVFFKHLNIMGSTMGNPEEFKQMLSFFEKNKIRPVIDRTYDLEEGPEAHIQMEKGSNFGKILLKIPD